ncbi:MAG: hypothetical protein H6R07_3472 [Proteobacteria bacterium]|nr:hypothetical protein [Pseudomonadota bacterium]
MGSLSIWHWLIVLIIVLLVFGTKKLADIGSDLGKAVKGFKDGMSGVEDKPAAGAELPRQDKSIAADTGTQDKPKG